MKINKIDEISEVQDKIITNGQNNNGRLIAKARSSALEAIKRAGFPTAKDEEWRFTNIKPLYDQDYEIAANSTAANISFDKDLVSLDVPGIVFVNGIYRDDLSDINDDIKDKLIIGNIEDILSEQGEKLSDKLADVPKAAFAALNAALFNSGLAIIVKDGVNVKTPVHIIYYTINNSGRAVIDTPRNIVVLGKNSRLQLVESYFSSGDSFSFTNILNQFWVEDGAKLDYYKIQRSSGSGHHIHNQYITQGKESRTAVYSIDFGGKLTRNTLNVEMNGSDVKTLANGIYFAKNDELVDNHVFIDHAKENGVSSELYRGILADKARGVFRGKIMVRPNAQKTDADQNNNCLLLSDTARINTMPQLEIYADDVKCTHGATVGELDDESVFYLRSRGIGEEQAKNILIKAFIAEVIEKVENDEIKSYIEELVDEYLSGIIEI